MNVRLIISKIFLSLLPWNMSRAKLYGKVIIHDDCIGIIFSLHTYIIYTVHQISLSTSNYIKLSSFLAIFCDSMWSFWEETNLCRVVSFHLYNMHCHWRSYYKDGVRYINRFNPSSFLCLFQTGTWISKVFSYVQWEVIVRFYFKLLTLVTATV